MENPLYNDSFAHATLRAVIQPKRNELVRLKGLLNLLTPTPPAAERDTLQARHDALQRELEALERIQQAAFADSVYYQPVRVELLCSQAMGFLDRASRRSVSVELSVPIAQEFVMHCSQYLRNVALRELERAG